MVRLWHAGRQHPQVEELEGRDVHQGGGEDAWKGPIGVEVRTGGRGRSAISHIRSANATHLSQEIHTPVAPPCASHTGLELH